MEPQPTEQPQGTDLSNKTLVMLVVLTCLVSLIGAVALLYEMSDAQPARVLVENNGQAQAKAQFTILAPGETPPAPSDKATGYATFAILEE